jgi:hypothetical protein
MNQENYYDEIYIPNELINSKEVDIQNKLSIKINIIQR